MCGRRHPLTSLGGLIAIGLFIMEWSIDEYIERFETLAAKTFRRPADGKSIFSKARHMISSFLQDHQYSSAVIAESFQSSFGEDFQLFNPLPNDTKVAITTTTAKETAACIFSNYNGGARPKSLGITTPNPWIVASANVFQATRFFEQRIPGMTSSSARRKLYYYIQSLYADSM